MLYHALENMIQNQFIPERELKTSERGTVSLLREKNTGKRAVCHRFAGSGEVYEALQNVDCPNLPHVKQVARQDGQVLVLEEYIQGDTLAFVLENRPLPEELAREILIQICHALKVLHSLGVVHRDVKPENIILRGDEAVLIDFDASRVCKAEQKTDTQVMGTTGYAAPEQFGFSQTDARADIFALGVLLNEMLSRQHPSHELAKGNLQPIIEKCIEVNVDKRYPSVDELLTALNSVTARQKSRKRWLIPTIAAMAALCISGVFLIPRPADHSTDPVSLDASEEVAEVPPAANFPSPSLQTAKFSWHGDPDIYGTEFRYDLDGDGEQEKYLFAAMYNFVNEPRLLQHSSTTINDKPEVLEVVPAVWVETGEENYEPVEEFAPLLSNASVNVRQIEGEHDGVVEQIGSLYGIWPGTIRATFEHVGLWYYECSAELSGETLTAVGSTRTELLSEAAASIDPYMTPFQYDLDGDGTTEQYWFGAVSQIQDGTFPLVWDGTSFYKGSGSDRTVAPAVWRQIGRDEYEQVQEFASLLENPQVNLRCVEGDVQPWSGPTEDLFGVWAGATETVFTHDGVWVYECSAALNGKELTAIAATHVRTRPPGT